MARLTITLSDTRYRALKETAARRGKTIDATIEECLDRGGDHDGDGRGRSGGPGTATVAFE